MDKLFISDIELAEFGKVANLPQKVDALFNHQKINWELLKNNYDGLEKVKTKSFDFNNFEVKIQFNPSRITSTSAKVDSKSISERKCFLCNNNLPTEQKGIKYKNDYVILFNPFPIFKQHLTIPNILHTPQRIDNSFLDLLDLTFDLNEKFFVFYNGPKCGASAPDHLHFQAGLKNIIPIENDYIKLINKEGKLIFHSSETRIYNVENEIRPFLSLESSNKQSANEYFLKILGYLKSFLNNDEEPLINILSYYENEIWKVIIFTRKQHRPKQYFANDETKLVLSPAAIDMAGLLITPREEDFKKISKNDVEDIYKQVSMDKILIEYLEDFLIK